MDDGSDSDLPVVPGIKRSISKDAGFQAYVSPEVAAVDHVRFRHQGLKFALKSVKAEMKKQEKKQQKKKGKVREGPLEPSTERQQVTNRVLGERVITGSTLR